MFLIDKYDPKTIKQIFFHKNILKQLIAISNKDNIPHMLFYGPSDSGKKTLIQIFLEMIFDKSIRNLRSNEFQVVSTGTSSKTPVTLKQSNYHIIIQPGGNNFDRHIIHDVVRTYARTKPLDVYTKTKLFKVVLINEADKLTPNAQATLRRTMEIHSKTCKFILWCNKLSGIIDPIRSRCTPIRVPSPSDGDIFLRLVNISLKENMKISLEKLTKITNEANGQIKKSLWALEIELLKSNVWKNKKTVEDFSIEPNIKKIVQQICVPNVKKLPVIRNMLYDVIVTNIDGTNIVTSILNEILKTKKLSDDKIKQLISISEYYEHKTTGLLARRVMMHLEPFIHNIFSVLNENKLNKKL
jgi:replication factor C subunit 3/5